VTALRSGELAAAAGVNPQTLRYYERRGLLPAPERSLGGHRLYPAEALERLRVIKAAQRLGFTLDDVAAMLGGGRGGRGPRMGRGSRAGAGLRGRAESRLAKVEAELAELTAVAATLRAALAAGCDDLAECAHEPACPIPFPAASAEPPYRPQVSAGGDR
jgi:MerR family mercuric resistance operon transcriptional regulator